MKHLKTYEGLFDIFKKSKSDMGDIIVRIPRDNSITVIGSGKKDMDINYFFNVDSFGFLDPIMRSPKNWGTGMGVIQKFTIEEYFKMDPENVIKIFYHMVENIDKHSCKEIIEIWKEKLPDLEMHLDANKYNI